MSIAGTLSIPFGPDTNPGTLFINPANPPDPKSCAKIPNLESTCPPEAASIVLKSIRPPPNISGVGIGAGSGTATCGVSPPPIILFATTAVPAVASNPTPILARDPFHPPPPPRADIAAPAFLKPVAVAMAAPSFNIIPPRAPIALPAIPARFLTTLPNPVPKSM